VLFRSSPDEVLGKLNRPLVLGFFFVGEGDANYKGLFKALRESGYTGRLAIETDSQDFARQPDDFVRKAKEFVVGNDASESR
jgi:sugar phosphate isomerase/epimerase